MTTAAATQFKTLTGTQKAAILLMLFGETTAAQILRNLTPREVQHLAQPCTACAASIRTR